MCQVERDESHHIDLVVLIFLLMLLIFQQKLLQNNNIEQKIHYPACRNKDDEFHERLDLEFHHELYLSLFVVALPAFIMDPGNRSGLLRRCCL